MLRFMAPMVALVACECGAGPSANDDNELVAAADVPPVSDYFPASAGDRWAIQSGDEKHIYGVTAISESGVAVFFGSDRTSAERFRVSPDAVSIVGPNDEALAPYLASPLTLGHSWTYRLGDTSCEATYESVDETVELAGLTLNACIKVKRICLLPGGKPFPQATTETHQEVYCPKVGRVAERISLEPAPTVAGVEVPARRVFRVTRYRVAGAPAPPMADAFDCDSFLLMPSDVHAACGPGLRSTEAVAETQSCTREMHNAAGSLRARVRRLSQPATDETAREWAAEGAIAIAEGHHVISLEADEAVCAPQRLQMLIPTIRSLLRD